MEEIIDRLTPYPIYGLNPHIRLKMCAFTPYLTGYSKNVISELLMGRIDISMLIITKELTKKGEVIQKSIQKNNVNFKNKLLFFMHKMILKYSVNVLF